jgi:membrane protein implicated in regulation of membrane protease activity
MARQPVRRVEQRRSASRERIPLPRHPYRDGALFHAGLACLLVFVAWLTGGGIGRALVVGALYFVLATAWTWWRFRQRLAREAEGSSARPGTAGKDRS